jgi:hypothetical protein
LSVAAVVGGWCLMCVGGGGWFWLVCLHVGWSGRSRGDIQWGNGVWEEVWALMAMAGMPCSGILWYGMVYAWASRLGCMAMCSVCQAWAVALCALQKQLEVGCGGGCMHALPGAASTCALHAACAHALCNAQLATRCRWWLCISAVYGALDYGAAVAVCGGQTHALLR